MAVGKCRKKSATKSGSASKWHSAQMHCLKAEAGGTAPNGLLNGMSWLWDIKLDNYWQGSHLTVG